MYELSYIAPGGADQFDMFFGQDGPYIVLDSIAGLVGEFQDSPVQSVGVPGSRVDFRDRVVAPMTGSFTLVVLSEGQWLRVRRAFSSRRYGQLVLSSDRGRFSAPVRLAQTLSTPSGEPKHGSTIAVSLVSDGEYGGVWSSQHASSDNLVTVTNLGDVPIWPEIIWDGAGGQVILPSGAAFQLPQVAGRHSLPLARQNAGRVFSGAGLERELSRQVGAVGEQVPVGESRQFQIPDGAELHWREGVLDPWI